jgi:hypothetical protein
MHSAVLHQLVTSAPAVARLDLAPTDNVILQVRTVTIADASHVVERPAEAVGSSQASTEQRSAKARPPEFAPAAPPFSAVDVHEVQPRAAQAAASMPASREHLPTSALDVGPMPRSSPDERHVENVHKSGLPIRIRLFVEDDGRVSATEVLSVVTGDEDVAQSVILMFQETAFIPGRLNGRDVASFIDIEIVLDSIRPEVITLSR